MELGFTGPQPGGPGPKFCFLGNSEMNPGAPRPEWAGARWAVHTWQAVPSDLDNLLLATCLIFQDLPASGPPSPGIPAPSVKPAPSEHLLTMVPGVLGKDAVAVPQP